MKEHEDLSHALDVHNSQESQQIKAASARSMQMTKYMSKCLLEAMEIDRPRAIRMLDCYRREWLDGSERERDTMDVVETMEEYYLQRGLNGGMGAFWQLVQFGMGIDISNEEEEQIAPIYEAATRALLLSNDYYSWEREWYDAQMKKDNRNLWNAIYLLVRTKGMTVDEAREALVVTIHEEERKFLEKRDAYYAANPDCPFYLRRYIEVIGIIVSGNSLWAATCPRNFIGPWNEGSEERHFKDTQVAAAEKPDAASPGTTGQVPFVSIPHATTVDDDNKTASSKSLSDAGSCDTGSSLPSDSSVTSLSSKETKASTTSTDPLYAPCRYIKAMPSKGLRSSFTNAFNQWTKINDNTVQLISDIIDHLHNSSLILDDIEDNSPLRRGLPATHTVFGPAQAINSANYMYVQAVQLSRRLPNPSSVDVLLEELSSIFLGQSWDLYWKFHVQLPREAEFMDMVDHKTGVMFRLLMHLMLLQSSVFDESTLPVLKRLAQPFGRFFQIRDDFMNLHSQDYADQKGICEDLDEGKISYPILRMLHNKPEYRDQITGILRHQAATRAASSTGAATTMSKETKAYICKLLNESNAMGDTLDVLKKLEAETDAAISEVEKSLGDTNEVLRLLIGTLSVRDVSLVSF